MTPEQRIKAIEDAERVASLEQVPAWHEFVRAAEHLIDRNTPKPTKFTQEEATLIASRAVYCQAVRETIQLVENAAKRAAELKEQD